MDSGSSSSFPHAITEAPILKLGGDLLWSIIKLNTDIFTTDDALISTRRYSQVCQCWRLFILQSPSLWGKLIDLNGLRRSTDLCRYEVLRRSGSSLLWIKGDMTEALNPPFTAHAFFFAVLNNHWDRIQKIDIVINRSWKEQATNHRWMAIYRPAPQLQRFRIHPRVNSTDFDSLFPKKLSSSTLPLFAQEAPSLLVFDARLKFSFDSPWLSTLRDVCIGFPLTFPEILDAVRNMPLLTSLKITEFRQSVILTDAIQPPISLPELTQLSIDTNIPLTLRTIACFQLPTGCSLTIQPSQRVMEANHLIYNAPASDLLALSKFTQNYFRSHLPKVICLRISLWSFLFSDYETQPSRRIVPTPFFSLIIAPSLMTMEKINLLFSALSLQPLDLHSVTHLHVTIHHSLWPDAFRAFASSLTSVDTITTVEDTLMSLSSAQGGTPAILFPILRVLRLESAIQPSRFDLEIGTGNVLSFLQSRKRAGYPVEVLDLTECKEAKTFNLVQLRLPELTIIWPSEVPQHLA
ncbi:hypothetical protein GALMADRAFT_141214 [Galerina marginata CBS 339.88]|uniref:F-box domain-containing protein n=1 Tax=Galerina marginata (strain CBS 339.88) TaxID=685588 RepID=A0A067T7C8_GALM3|nr:hypothetical protein GALMADRAFT_141214 [Galerina marginata CBS 339.88]